MTPPEPPRLRLSELRHAGDSGIVCPDCGCRHFTVLYTRSRSGRRIMRRRECRHCGRRITTYELRAIDT